MNTLSVDQFNEKFPVGYAFIWQSSPFLRGGLAVKTIGEAKEAKEGVVVQINDEKNSIVPVFHLTPVGMPKKV